MARTSSWCAYLMVRIARPAAVITRPEPWRPGRRVDVIAITSLRCSTACGSGDTSWIARWHGAGMYQRCRPGGERRGAPRAVPRLGFPGQPGRRDRPGALLAPAVAAGRQPGQRLLGVEQGPAGGDGPLHEPHQLAPPRPDRLRGGRRPIAPPPRGRPGTGWSPRPGAAASAIPASGARPGIRPGSAVAGRRPQARRADRSSCRVGCARLGGVFGSPARVVLTQVQIEQGAVGETEPAQRAGGDEWMALSSFGLAAALTPSNAARLETRCITCGGRMETGPQPG